jgi:hypothetical protein
MAAVCPFHAADTDQFILDVGAIPGSQLLDWLRGNRPQLAVGSVFNPEADIRDYYWTQSPESM